MFSPTGDNADADADDAQHMLIIEGSNAEAVDLDEIAAEEGIVSAHIQKITTEPKTCGRYTTTESGIYAERVCVCMCMYVCVCMWRRRG